MFLEAGDLEGEKKLWKVCWYPAEAQECWKEAV